MAVTNGYTLIELVVVVGLVSILAIGISSAVLINAVTATRTINTSHIRTTSDYSLNSLKHLIRSSRSIPTCDSSANSITIQNQDGATTAISLELDGSVNRIASGSGSYLTPTDIDISNFTITCLPSDTDPTLVKLEFDSSLANPSTTRESPSLHFATSVSPRSTQQ